MTSPEALAEAERLAAIRVRAEVDLDKRREQYVLGGPARLFRILVEQRDDTLALLAALQSKMDETERLRVALSELERAASHYHAYARASKHRTKLSAAVNSARTALAKEPHP